MDLGATAIESGADNGRFLVKNKQFSQQFAAMYWNRLRALRPLCQAQAKQYLDEQKLSGAGTRLLTRVGS